MSMGKNSRAVNAYLEENPDMKQQVDELSAQVGSFIKEYESFKGIDTTPEPPLPSQ